MLQQRRKADQQQTCHNIEQNGINNRDAATSKRTGSTTEMLQQ
jgi:hypothetical protein